MADEQTESLDELADVMGEEEATDEVVAEEETEEVEGDETEESESEEGDEKPEEEPKGRYKVLVRDDKGAIVEKAVSFDELKQGYQHGLDAVETRQRAEKIVTEAKEAATREVTQVREQSGKTLAELEALVSQALGIVTPDQLMSLATSNPDAYNEAFQRQQMLNMVRERLRQTREAEGKAAQEQQNQQMHAEMMRRREASLEALSKAGITTAKVQKIYDEAGPMFGFAPQELAGNIDYRIVLLLKDAAEYRRLTAKKPDVANKLREAPRLQPSNTKPAPRVVSKSEQRLKNGGANLRDLTEFFAKQ